MKNEDPFARPERGPLDQDRLGELARYANLMRERQKEVEDLEAKLKAAKKNLSQLQEESIPNYMQELGLVKISLDDGSTIKLQQTVYAAISKANHEAAMDWLINNNHEDLIKLTVTGQFGKDEYNLAREVFKQLRNEGAKVTSKEGVHPSTLRSFLKEQLEKGVPIPLETFGARPVTKAILS